MADESRRTFCKTMFHGFGAFCAAPLIDGPVFEYFQNGLDRTLGAGSSKDLLRRLDGARLKIGIMQEGLYSHLASVSLNRISGRGTGPSPLSVDIVPLATGMGANDIRQAMTVQGLDLVVASSDYLAMEHPEFSILGFISNLNPAQKLAWLSGLENPTLSKLSDQLGLPVHLFSSMGEGFGYVSAGTIDSSEDLQGMVTEYPSAPWFNASFVETYGMKAVRYNRPVELSASLAEGEFSVSLTRSHLENFLWGAHRGRHYHHSKWVKSLNAMLYIENPDSVNLTARRIDVCSAMQDYGRLLSDEVTRLNAYAFGCIQRQSDHKVSEGHVMATAMKVRFSEAQESFGALSDGAGRLYEDLLKFGLRA